MCCVLFFHDNMLNSLIIVYSLNANLNLTFLGLFISIRKFNRFKHFKITIQVCLFYNLKHVPAVRQRNGAKREKNINYLSNKDSVCLRHLRKDENIDNIGLPSNWHSLIKTLPVWHFKELVWMSLSGM